MTNKAATQLLKGVTMMTNADYQVFAAKATTAAATVVDQEDIQFYGGSMFVVCDSKQAAKIETALIEAMKCGVIVSKVGQEFAFDFVA